MSTLEERQALAKLFLQHLPTTWGKTRDYPLTKAGGLSRVPGQGICRFDVSKSSEKDRAYCVVLFQNGSLVFRMEEEDAETVWHAATCRAPKDETMGQEEVRRLLRPTPNNIPVSLEDVSTNPSQWEVKLNQDVHFLWSLSHMEDGTSAYFQGYSPTVQEAVKSIRKAVLTYELGQKAMALGTGMATKVNQALPQSKTPVSPDVGQEAQNLGQEPLNREPEFTATDVFQVAGRGTVMVVTAEGTENLKNGDTVTINWNGKKQRKLLAGIERYQKLLHPTLPGTNVGLVVRDPLPESVGEEIKKFVQGIPDSAGRRRPWALKEVEVFLVQESPPDSEGKTQSTRTKVFHEKTSETTKLGISLQKGFDRSKMGEDGKGPLVSTGVTEYIITVTQPPQEITVPAPSDNLVSKEVLALLPGQHVWKTVTLANRDRGVCSLCGIVKRRDGVPNRPCRGEVSISLRGRAEWEEGDPDALEADPTKRHKPACPGYTGMPVLCDCDVPRTLTPRLSD